MNFFSYNSPFMTFMRQAVDYFLLGILWILMSIPLFTFGAATTAALQTAESSIRKDEGKILATFWKKFRVEFKQSTILLLLSLPLLCIIAFNILIAILFQSGLLQQLLSCAPSLIIFSWIQLWYGYLSKFNDNNKRLLCNTFRMLLCSFGQSLFIGIVTLVALACSAICIILPSPILLVIPGCYIATYSLLIRLFFNKYLLRAATPDITPNET